MVIPTSLLHLAKALILRDAFQGALESPPRRASIADTLVISGWAFSRRGQVDRVEAFLDAKSLGRLPYGIERPDVARAFPGRDVGRSGFAAAFPLHPSIRGHHTIAVRVTDRNGQAKEYLRVIAIRAAFHDRAAAQRAGKAIIRVERAIWAGDAIQVEGYAIWPGAAAPLTAEIGLDGMDVGLCGVELSRPDVAERLSGEPGALRSGFRLSATLPSSRHDGSAAEAELRIILRAGDGRSSGCSTIVRRDRDSGRAGARDQFEDLIRRHESSHGYPPAILDWSAGLGSIDLAKAVVFSPLAADGRPVLPYADRSVDIVAVGSRRPEWVKEATRIATAAAIVVDCGRIETAWSAPGHDEAAQRVSIIIPAHGQVEHTEVCLRQLQATLGPDFLGEIIVVDDASTDGTAASLASWAARESRLRILANDRNIGFLESCNRAARAATGDVLVFLNNDTLPQRGWLQPLLDTLVDPGVGAVGAKLVYPDGRLQEAGGVTFADASGWNFGKGDPQADAPLFNHVREVDYCSGAALATQTDLFLGVGGFDTRFAPAYYEDTDYCFTLRARGYRVLYQPASVVIHAEGATSGTDERTGPKTAQAANRITFAEKWREALLAQPPPPRLLDRAALYRHVVRDAALKRALIWAPRLPEHDRESGSRRVYDTICFLRDAGWAVTFVAESGTGGERYASMLEQMGVIVYAGKESRWAGPDYLPDATELLTLGSFDVAILHFWFLAERHMPFIRRHSPKTRIIVDSVDLEFLRRTRSRYRNRSDGGEVLDNGDAAAMTRELNVYAAADAVLTVSAKEAVLINDFFGDAGRAHVVADAEDLAQSRLDFNQRRGLLFLANFRHPPNVEALAYLTREILPHLRGDLLDRHPIALVGNDLSESLLEQCGARDEHIHAIGWVPSVEPYLERARATIVPLRNGAGTKRKLIQAAMVGTPSVSTSFGVEGLNLLHGEHVLVADDPRAFAEGVARIVEDEALWRRLATAGRDAALAVHGREIVRSRFQRVLDTILQRT